MTRLYLEFLKRLLGFAPTGNSDFIASLPADVI